MSLPYAHANDDGSVRCPICGRDFAGVDETQETAEDAITKGATRVYAQHVLDDHDEEER